MSGVVRSTAAFAAVTAILSAGQIRAADWPEWRGPKRDGICTETGLLQTWPAAGPKVLPTLTGLGTGYSSVAISGGKIVTMGDLSGADGRREQHVIALNAATGAALWRTRIGPPHGDGSRCTPTLSGGSVYAIGTEGDVVCLDLATGREKWRVSMPETLGGRMMSGWKYSESPLVDGDKVLCTPGGATIMAALDKTSGRVLWKCPAQDFGRSGNDGAVYSSIVAATVAGVKQYVQMYGRGLVGVNAGTGAFLWGYNRVANGTANITTPVVSGDLVFGTNAYGSGSVVLRLSGSGGAVTAEEVTFLKANVFQNHHGGVVLVGGYLYGGHGQNAGAPTCIELKTGRVVWQAPAPAGGSAAVLYADGRLYFRYDSGLITLVEATPTAYKQVSALQLPSHKGPGWAHPVISGGRLYLRHDDDLMRYDLKAK